MTIILPPEGTRWVREDGKPERVISQAIIGLVDQQCFDGDGSPEGNFKAPFKSTYWDNQNQKLYFKSTPKTESFGWVALN